MFDLHEELDNVQYDKNFINIIASSVSDDKLIIFCNSGYSYSTCNYYDNIKLAYTAQYLLAIELESFC